MFAVTPMTLLFMKLVGIIFWHEASTLVYFWKFRAIVSFYCYKSSHRLRRTIPRRISVFLLPWTPTFPTPSCNNCVINLPFRLHSYFFLSLLYPLFPSPALVSKSIFIFLSSYLLYVGHFVYLYTNISQITSITTRSFTTFFDGASEQVLKLLSCASLYPLPHFWEYVSFSFSLSLPLSWE